MSNGHKRHDFTKLNIKGRKHGKSKETTTKKTLCSESNISEKKKGRGEERKGKNFGTLRLGNHLHETVAGYMRHDFHEDKTRYEGLGRTDYNKSEGKDYSKVHHGGDD